MQMHTADICIHSTSQVCVCVCELSMGAQSALSGQDDYALLNSTEFLALLMY